MEIYIFMQIKIKERKALKKFQYRLKGNKVMIFL